MRIILNFLWIIFISGAAFSYSDKDRTVRVRIIQGKTPIIQSINFETYLAGVIENEMPIRWPDEALKAQTVVARSYALAKMEENQNKDYDLDATTMDQVYQKPKTERSIALVQSTDQIVLRRFDGRILKAFYHADCGGQTVPASSVWPGSYDAGTATDVWCANRKTNHWSYKINKEYFTKQNVIQNKEIWASFFKDRIQSIKIDDKFFSIQKLRQIFGFSSIKNSPTEIINTPGEIILNGQGYGHGVGLCQWGSYAQAKLGRNFLQILSHYYSKAQVEISAPPRVALVR